MEREFQVGDRVRIRDWEDMLTEFDYDEDLDLLATPAQFPREMEYLCGEEAEITRIHEPGNPNSFVELEFLDVANPGYFYDLRMLELIAPSESEYEDDEVPSTEAMLPGLLSVLGFEGGV